MTSTPAKLSPEQAKLTGRALPVMFFTQGFIALAAVPRIPELLESIHIEVAQWGLVDAISGVFGLFSMFFGSRVVRKFGTRRVMLATGTIYALCIGSYGFIHSPWLYVVVAAVFSLSMGLYNLSLNTNAVTFQKRQKRVILGKFHASWSIGATATTAVGGILANFLSLQEHLVLLSALSLAAFWYFGRQVLPPSLDGHAERKNAGAKVPFWKSPSLLWWLAAGNITGVMCEGMLISWSSVFTQKTMELPLAVAAIPYTLFGLAMIAGRLSISFFAKKHHFSDIARFGGIFGSVALAISIWVGPLVSAQNQFMGIVVISVLWAIVGYGVAPMMPSIASATGNVPKLDTTQAMARMTLITSLLMMGAKIFMGGLVSAFTLQWAFMFVVVSFFVAALIAGKVAKRLKADEIAPNAFPETGAVTIVD
ncbi:MAG: MFS transporter [Micrococcales bacterium]